MWFINRFREELTATMTPAPEPWIMRKIAFWVGNIATLDKVDNADWQDSCLEGAEGQTVLCVLVSGFLIFLEIGQLLKFSHGHV
jgi:hypothetical protein